MYALVFRTKPEMDHSISSFNLLPIGEFIHYRLNLLNKLRKRAFQLVSIYRFLVTKGALILKFNWKNILAEDFTFVEI